MQYNNQILRIAEEIASQLNCIVVEIPAWISMKYISNKYLTTSPGEFIGWIKHAECIISASFHGTAFSIIFNMPFYAINLNDSTEKRSKDLLESLGLEDRLVHKDSSITFKSIDFEVCKKKLEEMKTNSMEFFNCVHNIDKMNKTNISIIVPVFNAEKYLSKCVDSVLAQSYTHFELLLIDDGSRDNSGFICDEYAQKDNRIKVFHQNNAGVSAARNRGISEAKGDYICFIDADDWVEKDYLYRFAEKIEDKDYDLIITGFSYDFIKTGENMIYSLSSKEACHKQGFVEIIPQLEYNNLLGSVWSKLFKKNIIKNSSLSFEINISYSEDTIFCWNYLFNINTMALVDYVGYHYVKNDDISLTKKMYSYETIGEIAKKMFEAKQKVADKYKLQNELKFIQKINDFYLALMLWAKYSMYEKSYKKGREFRLEKWKEYAEHKYMRIKPEESIFVKIIKQLLILKQYQLVDILMKIRNAVI